MSEELKRLIKKIADPSRRFLEKFNYLDASNELWDQFYQRFEDRFRGSEAMISDRLGRRYEARIKSLGEHLRAFRDAVAIDLGCGRGEMLALVKRLGFETFGVDISAEAVAKAKTSGHEASCGDIYSYIREWPADSAVFISLMHVVEHCPPKYVWLVVRECRRVLKPGGVLLIETPSLFSLWASQRQFFLDPTHQFPVHPDYVKFLAEDSGFSSAELLFFDPVDCPERAQLEQAAAAKLKKEIKALEDWLYGPMDFALWATK